MIRRPPRSTLDRSSAASDVYKRQEMVLGQQTLADIESALIEEVVRLSDHNKTLAAKHLSLIHISDPTRPYSISYAVFCLKTTTPQTHMKVTASVTIHAIV